MQISSAMISLTGNVPGDICTLICDQIYDMLEVCYERDYFAALLVDGVYADICKNIHQISKLESFSRLRYAICIGETARDIYETMVRTNSRQFRMDLWSIAEDMNTLIPGIDCPEIRIYLRRDFVKDFPQLKAHYRIIRDPYIQIMK